MSQGRSQQNPLEANRRMGSTPKQRTRTKHSLTSQAAGVQELNHYMRKAAKRKSVGSLSTPTKEKKQTQKNEQITAVNRR